MRKTVTGLHPAYQDDIGDLTTRRPVPGPGINQLDPFLFLNHHGPQTYPPGNHGLPFGPHPHRGFETVTFILAGNLAHRDSGGHESIIEAGGVQWMTAGRGIVHEEISPAEFRRKGGPMEILQLWVNLPSRLKMSPPAYTGLQKNEIPALKAPNGKAIVHLIAGEWGGAKGPIAPLTGIFMSTVDMKAGGRAEFDRLVGRTVFLYVVRGRARIGETEAPAFHLVELGEAGDSVEIEAREDTILLFGHGDPIREPVVAHGPFVMNTVEEIRDAIRDYQAGAFGV